MENNFYKFPSTPYLIAPKHVPLRSDKVMNESERVSFLSHKLTVEEKIDGANLGISFDHQGNIKLQNRGNYLVAPYLGQWKKLSEWLVPRENTLFELVGEDLILFGEWCYAQHSVKYTKLPNWFLGFDIFDKNSQLFWSVKKRDTAFEKYNIIAVPKIAHKIFTLSELQQLLLGKSAYSNEKREGIYLRIDKDECLDERAKMVHAEFVQNIQEHWSSQQIKPNKLEHW